MTTTVAFRSGFRLPQDVDAATAAERLLSLHEKHGHLTPEQVLADATRKTSPLHSFFQWDDATAAHEHRKWQARHLLGSLIITVRRPDGAPVQVRQFMHVEVAAPSRDDEANTVPRYMELNAVLSDDDLRQQQVDAAMAELGKWAARWAVLNELEPCFRSIARWRAQFVKQEQAA